MFYQWAQWQMYAERSFLKFRADSGSLNHETGKFDQTLYHLPHHVWDSVYSPNLFYKGIISIRRYNKDYKPKYYLLVR